MEVSKIRVLRGPNLWTRHTAIEAIVACDEGERSLRETARRRSPPARALSGDRVSRARHPPGTLSLAHALEFATLGLQAQAGCPVTFSRTAPTRTPGVFEVVGRIHRGGRGPAWHWNSPNHSAAPPSTDAPFDVAAALARLRELDEDLRLGPSTGAIVHAATARGIPYRRLTERQSRPVRLGQPPAPHPGRRDGPLQRHRGIRRSGQGADQETARSGRRSRAASAARSPMRRTRGAPPAKSAARWW